MHAPQLNLVVAVLVVASAALFVGVVGVTCCYWWLVGWLVGWSVSLVVLPIVSVGVG